MKTLRSFAIALIVGAAVAITANGAIASDWSCNGPFCNQAAYPRYSTVGEHLLGSHNFGNHGNNRKPPMPTYQAAPWYLYWPYDAHFLTPAPVTGAFYGPPTQGNFPVNPYFPGPMGGPYGPMPGGPPPR